MPKGDNNFFTAPQGPTNLYIEVPVGVAKDAVTAISQLSGAGFKILSDWHLPVKHRPLAAELIHLQLADWLIVWPAGLGAKGWLKIGVAYASGIRILALGSLSQFDEETKRFFALRLEGGFSELLANDFLKLGSLRYKKDGGAK